MEIIKESYHPDSYEDDFFSYKAHPLTTQNGNNFGSPYGLTVQLTPKNKRTLNCKINIREYAVTSRTDNSILSAGKNIDAYVNKTGDYFVFIINREIITRGHDINLWLSIYSNECMIKKELGFSLKFYKKIEKMNLWNRIRYAT